VTAATAAAARAIYAPLLDRTAAPKAHMTGRQIEALRHAANGNTTDAIGRAMGISSNSVQDLLRKAYLKLGANDRTQAVAVAIRLGLIGMDDIRLPEALSARLAAERPAPAPEPQPVHARPVDARTDRREARP
jgi:DNA-binding CsgD family transcriptional regulator